nr:MAG TPA: hypothetical protein [Siphoviridae sp. ctnoo6]DAL19313.1 MAG TPA_asm: hypothetical protein [Caudoviricetes sp.]
MLSTRLFYAVPAPRSCFRIWILMSLCITTKPFICLLKTSCPQCALIDNNLTRRLCRTGNYLHRTGCAVTHLS